MKKILLILFIEGLFIKIVLPQVSDGGHPVCMDGSKCSSIQNIFTVSVPVINFDSLQIADSLENIQTPFLPARIGIPMTVNLDVNNYGTWETLSDGSKIWRLKIVSQNAQYIALFYDNFWLPPSTKLFIYSEDGSDIIGAFTEKNNKDHGKFSTGPVKGESIILEYYQSSEITNYPIINITTILHINKIELLGQSASCMIDVKCPDGDGWCDQRRSVAMIIRNNSRICTGSLITNERRDSRPYFLTAEHCMDINGDFSIQQFEIDVAQNWLFVFNYQRAGCSTGNTRFDVMSGATVKAHRYESDFVLLELDERPPGNYNVYHNGFNNANKKPKDGACIHHPLGDVKKISIYKQNPDRENCKDFTAPNQHKTWRVKWEKGDTQGGSSGSPLFNENKLVVGQDFGRANKKCDMTLDDCDDKARSFFGRFDLSWDAGNSSSNRLRDWLSPNSTSNLFIESMSGDEPCKASYFFQNVNNLHTSANVNGITNPNSIGTRSYDGVYLASGSITTGVNVKIQSGTSVEFYGNNVILNPGFIAEAGSHFVAEPKPCLRGCNTGVGKTTGEDEESFTFLSNGSQPYLEEEEEKKDLVSVPDGEIQIYPNPTSGIFNLLLPEEIHIEASAITVYDIFGEIIYQSTATKQKSQINLSSHPTGIYFIKVISGENVFTNKIIIQ